MIQGFRISSIAGLTLACTLLAATGAAASEQALPSGCHIARPSASVVAAASVHPFPGLQLQIRTPVAPAVLASAGRKFLIYELHIQNFSADAVDIKAIEVIDAGGRSEALLATLGPSQLGVTLRATGREDGDKPATLAGGQAAVAFLCLAVDSGMAVPAMLSHRVLTGTSAATGPVIAVDRAALPVLGPPVSGGDWNPRNGPHAGSHHRMGVLVVDGLATIARRFAIDWRKSRSGAPYAGDPRELRSYHAYGEPVLAVADGIAVAAVDGFPDNVPRTEAGFETAVPITEQSIAGNHVVLDLGGGKYASYSHLQPGSVRLKAGQHVRRGQLLGRIGNSGDSRWPHLHFQLATTASILGGEGLPFLIDRFRIKPEGHEWQERRREFPWGDGALVDFGRGAGR